MDTEKVMSKNMIVCPVCRGQGNVTNRTSAYDTECITCKYCDGNRVVIEKVIHEKVERSVTNKDI